MKNFIIRITDPAAVDQQIAVFVTKSGDIGRAAQLAIDDMLSTHGEDFAFPLFLDIHPADEFAGVAALYEGRESGGGELTSPRGRSDLA